MEFHERLSLLLQKAGVTTAELSAITGKNPGTISNYRTGKSYPDGVFFMGLKELVPSYDSNWLIYGEGSAPIEINKADIDRVERVKNRKSEKTTGDFLPASVAISKIEKNFMDRIEELNAMIDRLQADKEFLQQIVKAKIIDAEPGKLEVRSNASLASSNMIGFSISSQIVRTGLGLRA
jgi:transcriptional regulator with XRE-family HTH domain